MRNVVWIFVDGLGLGDPLLPQNPLLDPRLTLLANFHEPGWTPPAEGGRPERLPRIERAGPLPHDGLVRATDPSLGVPGLPQSATGQTALLTGVNAAEVLDRHYTGFPTKTLRGVLMRESLFKQLAERGHETAFANAFTPQFFELGEAVWGRPMGATSWAAKAGGLRFRSFDDLGRGAALFHDITGETLVGNQGTPAPLSPEEAGDVLAGLSRENRFTLFEFFLTDKAGHDRNDAWARRELVKLERFLAAVLEAVDLACTTVVLMSDHGNVEDLRTKTHTHNPVPTLLFGEGRHHLASKLDRLEAFTPSSVEWLCGV